MDHIDSSPAPLPTRSTLQGRLVNIVPLDPALHAAAIYEGSHGEREEELWRYMGDGPFPSRAAFDASLRQKALSEDPLFFAIVDRGSGQALGYASYLRI